VTARLYTPNVWTPYRHGALLKGVGTMQSRLHLKRSCEDAPIVLTRWCSEGEIEGDRDACGGAPVLIEDTGDNRVAGSLLQSQMGSNLCQRVLLLCGGSG
jgi:hypothetical protein